MRAGTIKVEGGSGPFVIDYHLAPHLFERNVEDRQLVADPDDASTPATFATSDEAVDFLRAKTTRKELASGAWTVLPLSKAHRSDTTGDEAA